MGWYNQAPLTPTEIDGINKVRAMAAQVEEALHQLTRDGIVNRNVAEWVYEGFDVAFKRLQDALIIFRKE